MRLNIVGELRIRDAHCRIEHFGELGDQAVHAFFAYGAACHSHKRSRLDHQCSMRPSLGHCFLESADETVDSFVPPESHDVARDAVDGRNPFVKFGARFQPQPLSLASRESCLTRLTVFWTSPHWDDKSDLISTTAATDSAR
jgi:hypothetical protein